MSSAKSSKLNKVIGIKSVTLVLVAVLAGLFLSTNHAAAVGENGDDKTPPAPTTVQFAAQKFHVTESAEMATITVTRGGILTETSSVEFRVGLDDDGNDTAKQRSDFTLTAGTLRFAAGETQATFQVLINRVNAPGLAEREAKMVLLNVKGIGAALGKPDRVSLEIEDEVEREHQNPLDDNSNYVRQQYHDFLNRRPDAGGLQFWAGKLEDCHQDVPCLEHERREVSAAFYMSREFQETGYFVYKLEKVAFNRRPKYVSFIPEVQDISRNAIANGVNTSRHQFADDFSSRDDFKTAYDNLSNDDYVDTLQRNAGIADRPLRDRQVDDLNNNRRRRGDILQEVAEHPELNHREYNPAFVLMQYFGYLRRDPDEAGYQFWVGRLNDGTRDNYPGMVDSFVKALEYRGRFGDN